MITTCIVQPKLAVREFTANKLQVSRLGQRQPRISKRDERKSGEGCCLVDSNLSSGVILYIPLGNWDNTPEAYKRLIGITQENEKDARDK